MSRHGEVLWPGSGVALAGSLNARDLFDIHPIVGLRERINNSDKPIVLAVRPNPEPHDLRSLKLTGGAIAPADPGRVEVVLFIDFLEIGPFALAILAALAPAVRAARIDPAIALRQE
jgi:hypothetical protein